MDLPITPEQLSAIEAKGDSLTIDDLIAMGVDVDELATIFRESFGGAIQEQFETMNTGMAEGDPLQPVFIALYLFLLFIIIYMYKKSSILFTGLISILSLIIILFDTELNAILGETIGDNTLLFNANPFDSMGVFFTIWISSAFLIVFISSLFNWIWILIRSCCCKNKKQAVKQDKVD